MKKKDKDMFVEELVSSIQQDFERRKQERKPFEAQWKLNSNFYNGEQYVDINSLKDIEEQDKMYYWQSREVFNHIAPIVDSRLSKLCLVRPEMDVLPASSSDDDRRVARLSQDILRGVYEKLNLPLIISRATHWSETCGTSFYKVVWNSQGGKAVYDKQGSKVYEGEVEVVAVPPFEIYPDSNSAENVEDCESIIHAKVYSTREIKNIWGVDVEGEVVSSYGLSAKIKESPTSKAVVIEKYEQPSTDFPEGRLVVVCSGKLLYQGPLPYINYADGKRGFPFVKQTSSQTPGAFWGTSVIEKLIPVQRAYNAVKNRKHEFINRLSMGVLVVEDGSVDINGLEQDGLEPGKVLVYRQGASVPKFLNESALPSTFAEEEDSLLKEFSEISGVTDILSNQFGVRNLSGSAIELLLEADGNKIQTSIDAIKQSVKNVAKMILRLYKQFAVMPRLVKITGSASDVAYWRNSDLGLDDIQFLSDSTVGDNLSAKREQFLKLLSSGLFKEENGNVNEELKSKVLELFGISQLTPQQDNKGENE